MAVPAEEPHGLTMSQTNIFLIHGPARSGNVIEGQKQDWIPELRTKLDKVAKVIYFEHHPTPAHVLDDAQGCAKTLADLMTQHAISAEVKSGDIAILAIGLGGLSCAQAIEGHLSDSIDDSEVLSRLRRLAFIDAPFRKDNVHKPSQIQRYFPSAETEVLEKLCDHYGEVQEHFSEFHNYYEDNLEIRYYSKKHGAHDLKRDVKPANLSNEAKMNDMIDWIIGHEQETVPDAPIHNGTTHQASVRDTIFQSGVDNNTGIVTGGIATTAPRGVYQQTHTIVRQPLLHSH